MAVAVTYGPPLSPPRGAGDSPDPFDDLASRAMPRTIADALDWSRAIFMIDETYREAMNKIASYFVTSVEIKDQSKDGTQQVGKEERDKFEEFVNKTLRILGHIRRVASDLLCSGVSFASVLAPIRRRLHCPKCVGTANFAEYPLATVRDNPAFAFEWTNFEFHAKCPKCGYKGAWSRRDARGGAESEVTIKHWPPQEIDIIHDEFSDRRAFVWKIPESYRRAVREGDPDVLEQADAGVIQAVKEGKNFRFKPNVVYYAYEPPPACVKAGGWGLSSAVTNFRQAFHRRMLNRFNEAICAEMLVPFRVLSPEMRAGSDPAVDPMLGSSLASFQAHARAMVKRHKKDPTDIQISPVPIHYQLLGGEATTLAPAELLDQATDTLLNGSGVPAELYRGSLSIQAAPAALRLFESRWTSLVEHLNGFLEWVVDRVTLLLNWEPVDCRLLKARHADDMNRQMAILQLMMGGQISQQTGLAAMGLGFEQEQRNLVEEQQTIMQLQQQLQKLQQESGGAQAPPGGAQAPPGGGQAPPGGGQGGAPPPPQGAAPSAGGVAGGPAGGQPVDPQVIWDQAGQIAGQLKGMDDTQRRSEMLRIKQDDPMLHAVVRSRMEETDQQAATAGKAQILAQAFPKSAASCALRMPSMATLQRRLAG
jgi:hypothetical protein